MNLPPRLTVVTLGVRDVRASTAFYETLGFERKFRATGDEIAFIAAGGVVIALWSWDKFAADACLAVDPPPQAFRGTTLAWNCATPAEVNAAFARAMAAGAKPLRQPEKRITAAIADIFPMRTTTLGRWYSHPVSHSPMMGG